MVDATGIRGPDDDTGEENWVVQPEIFEGSDTATISGVGRFILLQVAGKQQVLFLDAEDVDSAYPDPEVEPLFWGSWGTEDALSCGKSGVWQLPAGESSIPRVL